MVRCGVALPGGVAPRSAPCDAPYGGLGSDVPGGFPMTDAATKWPAAAAYVDSSIVGGSLPKSDGAGHDDAVQYSTAPCSRPVPRGIQFIKMYTDNRFTQVVSRLTLREPSEKWMDLSLTGGDDQGHADAPKLARIASWRNVDALRTAIVAELDRLYGSPELPAPDAAGRVARPPVFDADSLLISFVPPDAQRVRMDRSKWGHVPVASTVRCLGGGGASGTRCSTAFAAARLHQYVFTGLTVPLDDLSEPMTLRQLLTPAASGAHERKVAEVPRDGTWDVPVDWQELKNIETLAAGHGTWGTNTPNDAADNTAMCAVGLFANQLAPDGCGPTRTYEADNNKPKSMKYPSCTDRSFVCGSTTIMARDMEAPVPLFPGPGMNLAASVITNALSWNPICGNNDTYEGDINVPADFPTLYDSKTKRAKTRLYAMAGSNLDPHQPLRQQCPAPREPPRPWRVPSPGGSQPTQDAKVVYVYGRLQRRAWVRPGSDGGAPRPRRDGLVRESTTLHKAGGQAAGAEAAPFKQESFVLGRAGALDDGCVDEAAALVAAVEAHGAPSHSSSAVKASVAPLVPALVEFTYRPLAAASTTSASRVDAVSMHDNASGPMAALAAYFDKPLFMPEDNPCDRAPGGGPFAAAPLLAADPVCDCRFTKNFPGAINYDLRDLYATVQQNEDVTVKPCMMSFCAPNGDDAEAAARILPPVPGPCDVTNYVCQNNMNVYGNSAGGIFLVTQRNVISNCGPGPSKDTKKPTLRAFAASERARATAPRSAAPVRFGLAEASLAAASALVAGAAVYAALRARKRRRGAKL